MLPIPFGRPLRFRQAAVLFAAALILFVGFLLIMADTGNPADRDCRDEVLSRVPVYPQAALVNRDVSGSEPTAGREWREYQTADRVDDVAAFYRAGASCGEAELTEDGTSVLCDGTLAGNHQVSYQARISRADEVTSVSLFIGWYCGTNG